MNIEHIRDDIAAGRAVVDEIFDAADRDEFSENDLARVDMLWRAVDALLEREAPRSTVERRPDVSPTAVSVLGAAAEAAQEKRDRAMEEAARLDAARDWLGERAPGLRSLYEGQYTPQMVRGRVSELYPANTPGQDGWTSFCEDWAAGTLAPAVHADALDAATGQGRR